MLRENLRLARPFLALLAIFAIGRWTMGVRDVPYVRGHHVFSLLTLTVLGVVFYGAFARRWLGYTAGRAAVLGMTLSFCTQLVIVILTGLSYGLGLDTYFNHPTALNSEVALAAGPAMLRRLGGLVGNTLFAGIAGALGWLLGGVLPDDRAVGTTPA